MLKETFSTIFAHVGVFLIFIAYIEIYINRYIAINK